RRPQTAVHHRAVVASNGYLKLNTYAEPTQITTGTGSGKTESFLIPQRTSVLELALDLDDGVADFDVDAPTAGRRLEIDVEV
ncbi:hypothetical protein ACLQ24_25785, partial [Micromonospora sp. DT4]|uniref:hypothetical protein n=1 Tax=Micromonospora sp. DT4 TaxID=3393438 RepID=UPI003CEB27C2